MLNLVREARFDAFVGRAAELSAFDAALAAGGRLLYVHGPGGVGKSALLHQFASLAERTGRPVVWADARETGRDTPSAAALADGALAAGALADGALADGRPGAVVLLDTAELLNPLEGWVRDCTGGTGLLLVVASRRPPPVAWRVDPGWRRVLLPLPLANFTPAEARRFLSGHDVPDREHAGVIRFTRGHPLALALIADVRAQRGGSMPDPASPDVVTALLDLLLDTVPGPAHRAALEASAIVRVTTQPLLAAMLDDGGDARELFDWLRSLSTMDIGARGIAPHDLVREALTTELRWRHPDRHTDLRRRATSFYRGQLTRADPAGARTVLLDGAFVHRDHPTVGRVLTAFTVGPDPTEPLTVITMSAREAADVRAMVASHEGEISAALAQRWLDAQPDNAFVVKDGDGQTEGFLQLVSLAEVSSADRRADPAVAAACDYLDRTPHRGEPATLVRFWLGRDTYQRFSPVQTAITLHIIEHSLTTPGLAVTLIACSHPEDWAIVSAHTLSTRVPAADYTVDGRTSGMFVHDWRALPPLEWLAIIGGLEPPPGVPYARTTAESSVDDAVPALTHAEFAAAVRSALPNLTRVDRLGDSPLLTTRVVTDRLTSPGTVERARALQQVIREAAAQLAESPRDIQAYRVLHHTYLQPAGTQARAREVLNLPTSTYRRHLAAGIDHLIAILWQREGDPARPSEG